MRILPCFLLLLLMLAPVRAVPAEGDWAARAGAYQLAEDVYREALSQTQDPGERQLIQLRRMAVAQLRNDAHLVFGLAAELAGQKLDPEVAMRAHLIEGLMAYRIGSTRKAEQAFGRARAIAETLKTAGAALALSECDSFAYQSRLDREGMPTVEEYSRACERSVQVANRIIPTASDPYWPLDVLRSTQWSWLWAWQPWEYSWFYYRQGNKAASDAWGNLSIQIYQGAILLFDKSMALSGNDPEWLYATLRMRTELAAGFALVPQVETLLKENQQLLDQLDAIYAKAPPGVVFIQQEQFRGQHHRGLARFHLFRGQVAQGVAELERAAEDFARAQNPVDQIDSLVEIAYQDALNDFKVDPAAVDRALTKAEAASQKAYYPNGRFYVTGFQGRLAARRGDLARAEKLLREAQEQVSTWITESGASPRGKRELLERPETRLFLDTLVDVLLKQGKQAEALELTSLLSAQSQVSALDLSRVKSADPGVSAALRDIEERRTEGEEIRAELRAAETRGDAGAVEQLRQRAASNKAEFYKAINEIRARDPNFERLVIVKPASFAALQKRLPARGAMVQYAVDEKRLLIFVITPEALKVHEIATSAREIEQQVRQARRLIAAGQADVPPLAELYATLLAPVEGDLAGKDTLIVIPNGPLFYLPFAALKSPGGYLVERVSLVTVTSSEVMDLGLGGGQEPSPSLLALANPDSTLPGAQREVEQVAELFPKRRAYYRQDATRSKLTPVSASVVHLATHGFLDNYSVNDSYLLLAGPESRLTTVDIYGLELEDVALVTLSACQTQLGERDPLSGQEVATLAQAFSLAGCPSMIASLWKVDDQATSQLMLEFYTQWLGGKSKAAALRQAQLKLLQAGMVPAKWAAFELIGDWQ